MFTIVSCIIIYSLKRFKLLEFIPRIIIRKNNINLTDEIEYYKKIYEKKLNYKKICFSCPTTLLRRPIVDIASRLNNENMCVFFPRDIIKGPNKIHLNKLKNIKINMYPTINLPITSMELPVPISPFFLKRFIRLLKQYDIIHIWVPFYISSMIIIFLKRIHILKKKIFLTMDTFPGLSFNTGKKMNLLFRTFYNSFGKIIFSTVDKIILYGQSMKKFANLVGFSNKKIEVIPTGVDLKILQKDGDIRKEFNIDGDEKIILFIGVINVRKGIEMIIQIADKLKDEKLKFILVGDSSKRKYYEKLVKLKKLDHMIIFTGFRRDVHNFYHVADLFLLPSKGEGLPGVLMESMLYGVAIVASDIPGVRDLIINNYNGYLCKNQDMDSFLNKIKILLTDNTKKRLFIENSKMYLTEKFDWNDKILLYNELCKF